MEVLAVEMQLESVENGQQSTLRNSPYIYAHVYSIYIYTSKPDKILPYVSVRIHIYIVYIYVHVRPYKNLLVSSREILAVEMQL